MRKFKTSVHKFMLRIKTTQFSLKASFSFSIIYLKISSAISQFTISYRFRCFFSIVSNISIIPIYYHFTVINLHPSINLPSLHNHFTYSFFPFFTIYLFLPLLLFTFYHSAFFYHSASSYTFFYQLHNHFTYIFFLLSFFHYLSLLPLLLFTFYHSAFFLPERI